MSKILLKRVFYNTPRWIRWIILLLWCGIIFYLSDQPGLASSFSFDFYLRKLAHLFEYAGLTGLTFWAFRPFLPCFWCGALLGSLFSFFYACSDEFHQLFVADRSGSIIDVLVDSLGIVLALLLLYGLRRFFYHTKKPQ